MKASLFICFIAIIGYCLSDECSTNFVSKIPVQCTSFGKCSYSYGECIPLTECSEGDPEDCPNTLPPDYKTAKCILPTGTSKCSSTPRTCDEYSLSSQKTVDGKTFFVDDCTVLNAGTGKDRCDLSISGVCTAYSNECTGLDEVSCNNNIPKDYSKECYWDTSCQSKTRKCNDDYLRTYHKDVMNENFCTKLDPSDADSEETCHYYGGQCDDVYEKCSDYKGGVESECKNINPLKTEDGQEFTSLYKCSLSGTECKSERKKCSDYDDSVPCDSLISSDNNKVCFLSTTCEEKYKTCELYFANLGSSEKTQLNCKDYVSPTSYKNCIWEPSGNSGTCREFYSECSEYKGKDKQTCESIGNCFLDRDTTCTEKFMYCEEAGNNQIQCANAKPTDDKRECIFHQGNCIENYKTCQDYVGNNKDICEKIIQYNGKKCVFDSTGCKPYNKICSEALNQEECKLISKTGVSNPDRKVCDYEGTLCFENYKYCNDYNGAIPEGITGLEAQTICSLIKPYDSTGNKLDNTDYKCIDNNDGVGCQKKIRTCAEAANSEQCNRFCDELDDKKYYLYSGSSCVEHYKECSDAPKTTAECSANIPLKDYITHECKLQTASTGTGNVCAKVPKDCSSYTSSYAPSLLCAESGDFCTYSSTLSSCVKKEINSCSDITINDFPLLNEELCNKFTYDADEKKKCSLTKDGQGCEEKNIEDEPSQGEDTTKTPSTPSTPSGSSSSSSSTSSSGNAQSQGNDSRMNSLKVGLFGALLGLLL